MFRELYTNNNNCIVVGELNAAFLHMRTKKQTAEENSFKN
jgi:hypothetical protein